MKGTRVIVTGRLKQATFDDKEGQRRTVVEIEAEEIAVSLTYATAAVTKPSRDTTSPVPPARSAEPPQRPAASGEPHPF